MAKVLFGILASEIRAKVGGVVYTRVRGTAVVRTKVIPKNPKSGAQMFVRSTFSSIGKAWYQTLTEAQRQTWIAFARQFSVRDRLGQNIFLTGHMWFMRLNRPIVYSGNALLTAPPAAPLVDQILSMTITGNSIAGANLTVTFDHAAGSGIEIFFWGTKPMSAGRNNFAPFFRLVNNVTGGSATSYNIYHALVSSFGTPSAGQASGIKAQWTSLETGAISVPFTAKNIWAA